MFSVQDLLHHFQKLLGAQALQLIGDPVVFGGGFFFLFNTRHDFRQVSDLNQTFMENVPVRSRMSDFIFIYWFFGSDKKGAQMILTACAKLFKLGEIRYHTVEDLRITHFYLSLNQVRTIHPLSPPLFQKLAPSDQRAIKR